MTWHQNPYYAWDTETTGISVEDDRIVTATLICTDRTIPDQAWLLDPLIDIPEAASNVHGITTEHARTHGTDAANGINAITEALTRVLAANIPIVIANAPYDLTILDRECRRHHLPTLTDRLGYLPGPILDPMCIDRALDKYRKGGRKLTDLCTTYGVKMEGAHTSEGDALAAARIMWRLAQKYPDEVGNAELIELHAKQVGWRADWAEGFADYLQKQGKDASDVSGSWPLKVLVAA